MSPRQNYFIAALAWITLLTALLPIGLGAVVTTRDAGMAFADWPTSDGHGMFQYPWLKATGDRFLEHGHRLAGALVGFASLSLFFVVFATESTSRVRWMSTLILGGVIIQGLLGGWRVLANLRGIALLHGNFAAIVFAVMLILALETTLNLNMNPAVSFPQLKRVRSASLIAVGLLWLQMLLGGVLRHTGHALAWYWHPWMAGVIFTVFLVLFAVGWQTKAKSIRWFCFAGLFFVVGQSGLGWMAWITKYGLPSLEIVATQHSNSQIVFRSLHQVYGIITFAVAASGLVHLWTFSKMGVAVEEERGLVSSPSSVDGLTAQIAGVQG